MDLGLGFGTWIWDLGLGLGLGLDNNVRKVTGGGWVVACRILVLSPGPGLCYSQRFSEILRDSLTDSD